MSHSVSSSTPHASRWDLVGILVSLVCLVHCLALPLAVSAFPALAGSYAEHSSFHLWILGLALPAGALAFWPGYREHRRPTVPLLGLTGLVLLMLGVAAHDLFGEGWDRWATVVGGALLVSAHIWNVRLRNQVCCKRCA